MNELLEQFKVETQGLLSWLADEGQSFIKSTDDITVFAATQVEALQVAAGEPGFDHATRFAANSVALYAGLKAIAAADQVDRLRREAFVRAMSSVLSVTARALTML